MKLPKILAAVVLSVSLYSCGCEDVDLGKLEFTNELIAFLPAQPAQGKSYYINMDGSDQKLSYTNADGTTTVQIPVRKTNYSGKFDLNSCKEYYTADQKVYKSQIEGENPVSFTVTYAKAASTDRFNNAIDKDNIGDMIHFMVEYNNKFPTPIQSGSSSISSYKTMRSFIFDKATASTIDNYTYKQEFLPNVTLNGVQHTDVYHIYLSEPSMQYRPEEQYVAERYPALDYIKGIYVKEGSGIIHADSFKGKQVAISVK